MHTVYLFGSDYASPLALHQALKRLLDLPDYYGCNADALNDCLDEMQPSLRLIVLDPGEGDTAAALRLVARVFRDNGLFVREVE